MNDEFDLTPDLSGFKGAIPKTYKAKKAPKPLKAGKKVKAWEEDRKELKVIFKDNGIVSCEIQFKKCVKNNFLGFAHTRRRNTLTIEQVGDPHFVVLACQPCHYMVDFEMQKEEAEKLLDNIVNGRGW